MKSKLLTILVVLVLLSSVFVGGASAQAYTAHFTTSITYMNVGQNETSYLYLEFYASPDDTEATTHALDNLKAGAAGSIFIGSLGNEIVPSGFQGDAVMVASEPMIVTLVQIPMDSADVKNRALSNGFSQGAPQTLIATVLKHQFGSNTIFSVQNADTETDTVTISFYDTTATKKHEFSQDITSGAALYVDAAKLTQLPDPFNGSAVVKAVKKNSPTVDGVIVSSVMELDFQGVGLKAFEGVATGAKLLYMPSALCNVFGGQNTSYAVQNTSLVDDTSVTVTFSDIGGHEYPVTKPIGPGAKASFGACEVMPGNTYGSATVVSTDTNVIAIGKAYGSGLSTAFNGVETGYQKVALAYVRWADEAHWAAGTQQRTFVTIQNVGADLPAGTKIFIDYNDPTGTTLKTHEYTVPAGGLPTGAKFNSNAALAGLSSFGYYGSVYGGAAIVRGPTGSQLTAVARVSTQTSPGFLTSEDYNSQMVP